MADRKAMKRKERRKGKNTVNKEVSLSNTKTVCDNGSQSLTK